MPLCIAKRTEPPEAALVISTLWMEVDVKTRSPLNLSFGVYHVAIHH